MENNLSFKTIGNAASHAPRRQIRAPFRLTDNVDLAFGRVHEAMGNGADMFAVLVAAQLQGPVIWIGGKDGLATLAPTGLEAFLDPARLILAVGATRQETLWAAEQAMQVPCAGCVVTELEEGPDLRESRRMQIAAEKGGCLGIALISRNPRTSAAQTRWRCEAVSENDASWMWQLTKNKNGPTGTWMVAWRSDKRRSDDTTGTVHLVAHAAA